MKCLLEIKYLLDRSESYYHLSNLYINDFCIWIQKFKFYFYFYFIIFKMFSKQKLKLINKELKTIIIHKEEIGWDLNQLEKKAKEIVILQEE